MAEKKRIVIVDDHVLIADSLKGLIESVSDFQVVAMVEDGLAIIDACRQHQPDLVIMDVHLPKMNGIEAISMLKKRWPALKILVLSALEEEAKARQALAAGALGYALKRSDQQTLLTAINHALCNKNFIDPHLNIQQNTQHMLDDTPVSEVKLTARERQILQLIVEGYKNREIAEYLHISLKTVESHRTNLMKKLDVHSVSELLQAARRQGFLLEN